ncbi:hypothetical protein MKEN_01312600 [Mycena kentingensis (nom. inval.)]|nr:hypothetical protein MKEN_01312600 [Mycena kentingensis (nom. inval.)]
MPATSTALAPRRDEPNAAFVSDKLFANTPLEFSDPNFLLSPNYLSLPPSSDPATRDLIVTPYNADAFERALSECGITHEFPFLVKNLRQGFPIGIMPQLSKSIIMENGHGVDDHPKAQEYVDTEFAAGRISREYDTAEEVEAVLGGPFVCSPLIIATSIQGPGKPPKDRVCRHLSKADKASGFPSVNSFIKEEKTEGIPPTFPTAFDGPDFIARTIALAPPGTKACSFDLRAFHRTIPFRIDHGNPFGSASASSNSGQVGGAIKRIWTIRIQRRGVTGRFEDDFSKFKFVTCTLTFVEIFGLVLDLNAPWHDEKCGTSFEDIFVSIGFEWDIPNKRARLPEEKRLKYLARIDKALDGGKVSLRDLQSVHGTLIHVSFIFRNGSSRLPAISNSFASYPDEFATRFLTRTARESLEWWRPRIANPNISRSLALHPLLDIRLVADASTSWGLGGFIGDEWFAMRIMEKEKKEDDIRWLEAVALEIMLLFLVESGIANVRLHMLSDNQTAIGILRKAVVHPVFDTPRISGFSVPPDDHTFAADVATSALLSAFPDPPKSRRPKQGDAHVPSPLRPFVPAQMPALAWQTPYGTSFLGSRRYLPPSHMALARAAISNSLAKSSKSSYAAGLLRFTQYCDRNSIPESMRMPAEPFLLRCFLADSIGSHGLKSAKNWLNGIAHWHHVNVAIWYGKDPSVKHVLRAVDKDGKFIRPPRGPVSIEHMRCIRDNLDLTTPKGAAYWALSCAAFWGCRRLGELTILSNNAFDPAHDVSRSAHITRSSTAGRSVVTIHLPWTKTTGSAGGSLILTSTDDDLCPVCAFDNHIAVNHSPNEHTPLFAYRSDDGWIPPVKAPFLAFLCALFRTAKLDQVFGHSFRIGGSVFLLCSGVEPEIVMKIGGWSSTCFLIYWRKLETLIPAKHNMPALFSQTRRAVRVTHLRLCDTGVSAASEFREGTHRHDPRGHCRP